MVRYLIGIDEAGRGPLAGPVAVGIVVMPLGFDRNLLSGIKDSKKLSAPLREEWFKRLRALGRRGQVRYVVSLTSHRTIDRCGINGAIARAMERALRRIDVRHTECLVLLDGGLRAPRTFTHQRTIVRGDETEAVISLASIVAKVTRDRHMSALARRYPSYDFEVHKGYGTSEHYKKLRRHGLSPIHRRSFLRRFALPAQSSR